MDGERPEQEAEGSVVYERMRTRMLRMFGREPWVEDVAHAAFETFLEKRHTLRDEGSVDAFALRIALNAARDVMRRQRRTTILDDLFVAVRDPDHVTPGCGEEHLLRFDGHEFHWF